MTSIRLVLFRIGAELPRAVLAARRVLYPVCRSLPRVANDVELGEDVGVGVNHDVQHHFPSRAPVRAHPVFVEVPG